MNRLIQLMLAIALAILAPASVRGQAYPSKPVKIMVGFTPGGTPDIFARLIAQKMSENWGAQVVVENRPGATGNIAGDLVAKSAPDGYTVLYCDSTQWASNPHLMTNMPFDPFKDLAPVIQTSKLPVYLTVSPSFPASTLAQFIAHVRQHPGKYAYASTGSGSLHHLTAELFKQMAGVDFLHVPYKGAAPAALALLSGDVQVAFLSYTSTAQFVTAGKLRIIAISTPQRSTALPNVPTIAESGVPGFDMASGLGALVAAGTPREVIEKLNSGIAAAVVQPDVAAKMTGFGVVNVTGSTPEQFGAVMRAEYEKFGKLVKLTGARME